MPRARYAHLAPLRAITCLAAALVLAACSRPEAGSDAAPADLARGEGVRVAVSIIPHESCAKALGGEWVRVLTLVPPGANHHTYEPTPRQMTELARCAVYFRVGLPFEEAVVERIHSARPDIRIVDLREGVALREMEEGPADTSERAEGAHNHEGADPHIWLAPTPLAIQARTIARALEALDSGHASAYTANLDAFLARLTEADARARAALAPYAGRAFYVFHPSFGYFADAYGLKQRAIEVAGKEPSPRGVEALIAAARADGVRVLFVQPQFSRAAAEAIASAIGGHTQVLDPFAPDGVATIEEMATRIASSFAP